MVKEWSGNSISITGCTQKVTLEVTPPLSAHRTIATLKRKITLDSKYAAFCAKIAKKIVVILTSAIHTTRPTWWPK